MAENKSDNSKYESMYGGGFITSAQYICERLFENIAKKRKKTLGNCFWNDPYWKKDYQWQIVSANKLLKTYTPSVIIQALKDKNISFKILSLGAISSVKPYLDKLQFEYIEKQKNMVVDESIKEINENPEKFTEAPPQKAFGNTKKTNVLNKLKGL